MDNLIGTEEKKVLFNDNNLKVTTWNTDFYYTVTIETFHKHINIEIRSGFLILKHYSSGSSMQNNHISSWSNKPHEKSIRLPSLIDTSYFERRIEGNKTIYLFAKKFIPVNPELYYY